jgi:P-type Cu+ transporter
MAVDPVCGMHVDEQQSTVTVEHGEQAYFFCSEGCKKRFLESPDKYVARQADDRKGPGH